MMAVNAETLMAYLDGELDAAARSEVETAIAGDPELSRQLESQRRLRETLRARYDPIAEEPVPARLRGLLDPVIVSLDQARQRRWRPSWPAAAAIAASLVAGMFIGRSLPEGMSGPVGVADGRLVAQGALADALDRQLASEQGAGAATRIGLSFARADGSFCRTFDSATVSGLACRADGSWQLVTTATGSGPARGDYRQAGSGSAAVLEAAQRMMAGEPLDAAGERRARDAGWQRRP